MLRFTLWKERNPELSAIISGMASYPNGRLKKHMEGNIAIESVRLRNLLSFGPAGQEIILNPLTVLIGPNGSGKSNLIESLALLQATPRDLLVPIRTGGGTNEWLWKGITAEM